MRGQSVIQLVCLIVTALAAPASAGVADVLRSPRFDHLELAPIAPALANTVASTYPVASASSSVTYAYNPALDTLERQAGVSGPILGERAETIGKGQFDVAVSYSYVHLTTINGDDLGALVNRPRVNGKTVIFPVARGGGLALKDGRFTNFLPVRVVADLDVQAHILAPSLTYGVTPDLDVNLTLPLLRTSLDVTAHTQAPDPRFPQFTLQNGHVLQDVKEDSDDAVGVGDLLLRAKYVLARGSWVDVAAALGLSLPTGSSDDLQGTGTTRVQPTLVLSHVFADRVESLLNVGVDVNADDGSRSVGRWALGATAQVVDRFSATLVFFGRHGFAPLTDRIPTPFFFQVERTDEFDASIGSRWRFAESGFVGLNAIVPMNGQGLRPDAIPTLEIEYAF